jgi:hypothetical protein
MNRIGTSGGMGREAIEIGFQHAVREVKNDRKNKLCQIYLIGDIGPNTKEEVDERRNDYQFWKGTKFEEPAYWDEELAKLKEEEVIIHTFYVSTSAKADFEEIAKRTGGTCTYLDLS